MVDVALHVAPRAFDAAPNAGNFLPTYLAKGGARLRPADARQSLRYAGAQQQVRARLDVHSTDGAWSIGDLTKDLAFRLYFAKFRTTQCTAQLLSLELNGGISEIDFNFNSTRPPGTTINFEVQVNGAWVPLGYYDTNPLVACRRCCHSG